MFSLELTLGQRMADLDSNSTLARQIASGDEDASRILLRRIAAGDEDSLRTLFEVFGQRMYAYALRLVNDPSTADDVLQESLVAVWKSAKRFRGDGRVIAWLLGIIHHKALNHLRRKPHQSLDSDEENMETKLTNNNPTVQEQIIRSEQQRLLRNGLDALSLEHRMVIELVFYQGLSLAETAEVCGCPVGTVKSRLNYAKSSLRGILNRAGVHEEDIQ